MYFRACKNRGENRGFCNKKRGEEKMKKMRSGILKNRNILYLLCSCVVIF